jgi:hypothetical protein
MFGVHYHVVQAPHATEAPPPKNLRKSTLKDFAVNHEWFSRQALLSRTARDLELGKCYGSAPLPGFAPIEWRKGAATF